MKKELKTAVLVGGIAGFTLFLANLLLIDLGVVLKLFSLGIILGFILKAIILMALGAFVVFVNSEEDLKKAFQLGIMAPSIVIGAMNGNNYFLTNNEMEVLINGTENEIRMDCEFDVQNKKSDIDKRSFSIGLVNSVYAQFDTDSNLKKGKHNEPSASKLLWYGITGRISNGWFVFVGSHRTKEDANKQADKLKNKGYDAIVYPPFKQNGFFGVAIGSYLTLEKAKELKAEAIKDGLSNDTYLWKWKH